MILQNSRTIPGQKALFFKFKEFSRTKVEFKEFSRSERTLDMILSNKGITKVLLICAFVIPKPRRQVFSHQGPFMSGGAMTVSWSLKRRA